MQQRLMFVFFVFIKNLHEISQAHPHGILAED